MFRLNPSEIFYKDDHFPLPQAENNNKQSLAISIILDKATGKMNESYSVLSAIYFKTDQLMIISLVIKTESASRQNLGTSWSNTSFGHSYTGLYRHRDKNYNQIKEYKTGGDVEPTEDL